MKRNTKIYNKFTGYTPEDCDCKYCAFYGGKKKGKIVCLTKKCCCEEERAEAYRRTAEKAHIYGS